MGLNINQISDARLRRKIEEADALQNHRSMGQLAPTSPEQPSVQTLVCQEQKPSRGKSRVEIRVVLISFRRRLLDEHDSLAFSCKPLVDEIARTLELDDADPRLKWEYHQVKTTGITGCLVRIETL